MKLGTRQDTTTYTTSWALLILPTWGLGFSKERSIMNAGSPSLALK